MIDLAAERERSLARQEERAAPERIRHRALRALALRWNASPAELREGIEREWPNMPADQVDELLAATLEVQRTERQTITPEEIQDMPKALTDEKKERIREFVERYRTEHPDASGQRVHRALTADPSLMISESKFYRDFWTKKKEPEAPPEPDRIDQELAEDRADFDASLAPVNRVAAADLALSDAVHTNGDGKAPANRVATLADEVRSLRATYEADDFMRLEEEDGEFVVRASLRFRERSEAAAALAALAGAV